MPRQEVFLDKRAGERQVEVLKTYDEHFAREAFHQMDDDGLLQLRTALRLDESYAPEDLPSPGTPEAEDFLWDELIEASREDGSLRSFFVVNSRVAGKSEPIYVSPDWPSAQVFATRHIENAI